MKGKYIVVCWLENLGSLQFLVNPKAGVNSNSAVCQKGMFNQEGIKSLEHCRKVLDR